MTVWLRFRTAPYVHFLVAFRSSIFFSISFTVKFNMFKLATPLNSPPLWGSNPESLISIC